jgi:tryptophan 2,3-dioxygenase
MTPIEFLEFRNFITPSSGFQSLQFRVLEMKLGLTDRFRSAYKTEYFTRTMFQGKQANELEKALQEDSLLCQIEVIHQIVILINGFHKYYSVLFSDG